MKFLHSFKNLFEAFDERKAEERYMNQATSMVDLEMRQRRWDRANRANRAYHLR